MKYRVTEKATENMVVLGYRFRWVGAMRVADGEEISLSPGEIVDTDLDVSSWVADGYMVPELAARRMDSANVVREVMKKQEAAVRSHSSSAKPEVRDKIEGKPDVKRVLIQSEPSISEPRFVPVMPSEAAMSVTGEDPVDTEIPAVLGDGPMASLPEEKQVDEKGILSEEEEPKVVEDEKPLASDEEKDGVEVLGEKPVKAKASVVAKKKTARKARATRKAAKKKVGDK